MVIGLFLFVLGSDWLVSCLFCVLIGGLGLASGVSRMTARGTVSQRRKRCPKGDESCPRGDANKARVLSINARDEERERMSYHDDGLTTG